MLNIFKKSEPVVVATKVYSNEIEQIHHEFETAGDNLYNESLSILKECAEKDLQKGKRLALLGFTGTRQAKEANEVIAEEQAAKRTAEIVKSYAVKYPLNKFITDEMVDKICAKYGLVCGDIALFKGFVPNEKLDEIERFRLKDDEEGGYRFKDGTGKLHFLYPGDLTKWGVEYLTKLGGSSFFIVAQNGIHNYGNPLVTAECVKRYSHLEFVMVTLLNDSNNNCLQICAPIKDMDTTGMRLHGRNLVKHVPDPVVLCPVEGGYLIVSAWGDEASDPIVVNQINN